MLREGGWTTLSGPTLDRSGFESPASQMNTRPLLVAAEKILRVLPTGMGVVALLLSLTTVWGALGLYEKSKELMSLRLPDIATEMTKLPGDTRQIGSYLVDRLKEELSAKELELKTLRATYSAEAERLAEAFGVEKEKSAARQIELAAEQGSLEKKTSLAKAEKEAQLSSYNNCQSEKDAEANKEKNYLSQLNTTEFETELRRKIQYNAGPPRIWSVGPAPGPRIGGFELPSPLGKVNYLCGDASYIRRWDCWLKASVACRVLNEFEQSGMLARAETTSVAVGKALQASEATLKSATETLGECKARLKAQEDAVRSLAAGFQNQKTTLKDRQKQLVSALEGERTRLRKELDYFMEHPKEAADKIKKVFRDQVPTKIFFWWLSVAGFCTNLTLTALAYLRLCLLASIFGPRIILPNS